MLRMSSSEGSKGKIKDSAEDFLVEEITKSGKALSIGEKVSCEQVGMQSSASGKFTVFVMQKRDWNTIQALKMLAKKAGRGIRSTAFAGTKDRASISTQLCSIFGANAERVSTLHVKDITINGAWQSDTGVEIGGLLGNRFTITVRETDATVEGINKIASELNGICPNYFGEQRFGFRSNNVSVGLSIIKGEFEQAAMDFLTNTSNERNLDSIEAREKLGRERDFKAALEYFPRHLKYEMTVIEYLSRYTTDYANAMRRLPRQLTLMFVHSVESQIFNKEVESRVSGARNELQADDLFCEADKFGFPDMKNVKSANDTKPEGRYFTVGNIVGYESKQINDNEKSIMDGMGITQEMFKIQSMPELSCKGNYRALFTPFTDFSCEASESTAKLSFSLPAGAYATVLMDEFIQNQ